ncbi:unnamed protein product [Urochloa humidicola]
MSGRFHSEPPSRDAHLASPFVSLSDPPPTAILLPQILLPSASATPQSQTIAYAPFPRFTTTMAVAARTAGPSHATNVGTPSPARTSTASCDRVGITSRLCAAAFSCSTYLFCHMNGAADVTRWPWKQPRRGQLNSSCTGNNRSSLISLRLRWTKESQKILGE